jgi:signal transduction histidine kinase
LWAEGNQAGAIRLEQLWNDLSRLLSFSLFCGYPLNHFQGEVHAEAFARICGQHSGVLPAESYALLGSADERLREIALLQQKARSLEAEIEQRRKAEHQKDELIGIISHELKTPVTSVKGYTQILQKRFRKTEDMHSAALVTKMEAQLNKLIGLISELVDATRIEGGKLQFNPQYFDFNELVLEIVEQMQFTTEKHQIVTGLAETKTVWADRERVGQVISNFITNAVKYSPPSTEIQVTTWLDPVNIMLGVQDCGIGVPAEDRTKVFERFYRVSGEGRETYPGLGLGLYISSEIVRRHQGRIWVDSQPGKGSHFAFSLPLKSGSHNYE